MAKKYEELPVEESSFELGLQELQQLYSFANPVEIRAYLQKHPFLIELLQETQQNIKKYFEQAKLVLERTAIPDDNSHCKLMLTIHPVEAATDVLARYNELKYSWWVEFSKQVKGNFCLDVEHSSLANEETAWDVLFKYAGTYDGPEDWSAEHNHYLYGTPKGQ